MMLVSVTTTASILSGPYNKKITSFFPSDTNCGRKGRIMYTLEDKS